VSTQEFEHNPLEQDQGLTATREWLGKPVFKDRSEPEKIVRDVSHRIDTVFERDSRKVLQDKIRIMKVSCQQSGLDIAPGYISSMMCLYVAESMQHQRLQSLAGGEKVDQYSMTAAAGTLDVLKGFKTTMISLTMAFVLAPEASGELPELCIKLELSKSDPKGFLSVKKQAEFLRSPLRRDEGSIKPYEDQGLIVAGAELGATKYKRMYPIAERILSSGS